MSSNESIVETLKKDGAAMELAVKHGGMELVNRLKQYYEMVYGAVNADMQDWHWIATTTKNTGTNQIVNKESDDADARARDAAADAPAHADPADPTDGAPATHDAADATADTPAHQADDSLSVLTVTSAGSTSGSPKYSRGK